MTTIHFVLWSINTARDSVIYVEDLVSLFWTSSQPSLQTHFIRGLGALMRTLLDRKSNPVENSYTNRLFNDSNLLHSKILEEAQELVEASTPQEVTWEAADVIYFTLVKCAKEGVSLQDVEKMLDQRALKVTRFAMYQPASNFRRAGDAKPGKNEQPMANAPVKLKRLTPEEVQVLQTEAIDSSTLKIAREIVEDIQKRGDAALRYHAKRLGDIKENEPHIWSRNDLQRYFDQLPEEQRTMLIRTAG